MLKKMKNRNKNWKTIHEETAVIAKWIALYEAINIIADKAEERGKPFKRVELKPLAIKKYISSTENIILKKLLKHDYNIDICYDDNYEDKDFSEYEVEKY
jgi:hypothetical protein